MKSGNRRGRFPGGRASEPGRYPAWGASGKERARGGRAIREGGGRARQGGGWRGYPGAMTGRCPDCGMRLEGEVCSSCGAFDFAGLTSWVCFACGAQNAHHQGRCGCGRERVVECAACGAEVPFAEGRCAKCGTGRELFEAAKEARARSEEVLRLRRAARSLTWRAAPMLCLGACLLWKGSTPLRMAGGGLVGLSVVGGAYALVTARQARRQVN